MSIEKQIESVEEKVEDRSLAYEILQELKQSNKNWRNAFFAMLIALMLTIAGFLFYLYQYDYVSSYEYSATGVNAIIDNEGNVIAQDIPDDKLLQVLEILNNGNGKEISDPNQNP